MPHPDSVIDTAIADYRQDFYDALVAMEEYTYEESDRPDGEGGTAGVEEYQPFWQAYSNAIMDYLDGPSTSGADAKDFIIGLYAFLSQLELKGRGSQSLKDDSNARKVFDIDGLVDNVLSRPVDYYDDYEPDPDPEDPNTSDSAPRLEADTAHASGAMAEDESQISALQSQYVGVLTDGAITDIFAKPPEPPEGEWDGLIAWDTVFDELEWQWAVNQVGFPLTIPPRPE